MQDYLDCHGSWREHASVVGHLGENVPKYLELILLVALGLLVLWMALGGCTRDSSLQRLQMTARRGGFNHFELDRFVTEI